MPERPSDEKVCPICGKPYLVVQTGQSFIRVGCWDHWIKNGIWRDEPTRSINGYALDP